jgi:hypothetical protein
MKASRMAGTRFGVARWVLEDLFQEGGGDLLSLGCEHCLHLGCCLLGLLAFDFGGSECALAGVFWRELVPDVGGEGHSKS